MPVVPVLQSSWSVVVDVSVVVAAAAGVIYLDTRELCGGSASATIAHATG
jgi:hypothetical protein